jgi:zinc protease
VSAARPAGKAKPAAATKPAPTARATAGRAPKGAAAPAATAVRPRFEERTEVHALPGGGTLQTLSLPGTGTVVVHGNLRAGAALDTPELPGLADLTARALDLGTASHTRLQIAEEMDGRGVSFRFWGGTLTSAFSARCLREDFDVCTTLLVEMLREPAFPEVELVKLKQRTAAQIRENADNTQAVAYETFHRALYPDHHPLWVAPIEQRLAALDRMTVEEVQRFHREAYGSRDLLLTVVGDCEGAAVRAHVEKLLAGWSGPAKRTEPWEDEGRAEPPQPRYRAHMPGKSNIDVVWGHRAGLRRASPDYLAAILGNMALGGSTLSSRLGVRVRDTEGLTYGIFSRFSGASLSPGPWAVSVTVAPENLEKALKSTREVVEKTLEGGLSAKELDAEQEHMAGSFAVGLATNDGIARQLHDAAFYGFGPGYLDRFPALVRAVTRAETNEALRENIRPADCIVSAAGPLPA